MDKSAIILAGDSSKKSNIDKSHLELNGKSLLNYVIDSINGLVDEVIIVTNSKERAEMYKKTVSPKVKFATDSYESRGPLVGIVAGLEAAMGDYSLLWPVNSPFVSKDVVSLLFECCVGKSATIPRYTNMEIEPLHAVYQTQKALDAAKKAIAANEFDMGAMVNRLRGVRYISTMVIEQLDPELRTFFNINTPLNLKKTTSLLNSSKATKKQKEKML